MTDTVAVAVVALVAFSLWCTVAPCHTCVYMCANAGMIATSYFALARIGVGMFTLLKVRTTVASA